MVKEIICDLDKDNGLILFDIHWQGGVHTKLKVKKNKIGEHRNCTDKSIVELVRELSKMLPDKAISPILNRLKLKTGAGNNWTRDRVKWLRNHNGIEAYNKNKQDHLITLEQAAERLGICAQSVRGLIEKQIISANQVIPCAPWAIPMEELEKNEVKIAVKRIRDGANRRNQYSWCKGQLELFQ